MCLGTLLRGYRWQIESVKKTKAKIDPNFSLKETYDFEN